MLLFCYRIYLFWRNKVMDSAIFGDLEWS